METFTKSQLNFINDIKKELGLEYVWRFFEIKRIESEIGHMPSIDELTANGGESTRGTWCLAVGGLTEAGFLTKKTRVQTVEDLLFESNLMDTLWKCVKPFTNEDGFSSIDNKSRAQSSVHTFCEAKAKATPDKQDIISSCEEKTLKNIEELWNSQFQTE